MMNTEEAREVTKMTATSTTPSSETSEQGNGSAGPESEADIKRRKKKKGLLGREQKGKEESSADSDKTKKRIFYELPKCNWLEEKIKDIEQSKRTEEMRRNSLDRMIEEELSRRKTITLNKTETEPQTQHSDPIAEKMNVSQDIETPRKESRDEQFYVEIQDELLQQKDSLLKDIRVIQKRKIKEMEELYEIKLKKKSFEQELEDTKLEIKRMDEQFEILRRKKADLSSGRRSSVDLAGSGTSDVKIIDNKRPAPGHGVRQTREEETVIEERFPRPKQISPAGTSGPHGRSVETLRVRNNLMETAPPPPYYAGKERPGGAKRNLRQPELQTQEQAMPTLLHQDGQREREPPVYSAPSQASSLPPQRPSSRSAFDNLDMARIQEEARQSFQPYKPHRRQESGGYFLPQLREYKDAILIPVRSEVPPLVDQYRGMLSYHQHLHHLDTPLNLNINPTPIRPTPHRSLPLLNQAQAQHCSPLTEGGKSDKYLAPSHHLQESQRKHGQEILLRNLQANIDVCEGCGKEANFMCSACRGSHYCSTDCQRDLWPSHSKHCKPTSTL